MKSRKKITALFLSFIFMINMLVAAVPVSAEAGVSKTYIHDGYTVEYKVTSEWTGYQNIQVTIINTGDNVISNWSMGYNAHGKINGLWNAQIYGCQGTDYILSGASYNCEIEPGRSTNFGYTLSGDNLKIPQDIINCSKRVGITDGYNVYYNVVGDYGDTYQAEMVIENTSDTDISAWQLAFDGNITIDNLWNGKLLEKNNGSFKVKNAENNVIIKAKSSVRFNFSGSKNFIPEPAVTQSPVTSIETETAEAETTSETTVSQSETTEEVTAAETESVTEAAVKTNSDIVIGNYKLTGVVIPMEFDFEIDPEMDSDNDELPDYLEKEIGSDRYNPDTDGDGLPDGYEYFTLETEPTKVDSDNNGISDANEDFDKDRLSNIEEYKLGTNPFSADSDCDGLLDYDEVNVHHTDPLKYDTDSDKVSDGDEITLGLNPNNPATHGYPDSEYTTQQTVSEDSSALDYINTIDGNPYTVSVDITAAGVAQNCLSAGESGYSSQILQNDAVLGIVPELTYSEGLSITDAVIKFNLDDTVINNNSDNPEFNGINRFNVFKYFEDTNMLLPVETSYDEATNTVSTHVDEVGTYCLIDMEKWITNIENMPDGNYPGGGDNEPANVVFCLDTRNIINAESFEATKSDIKAITEDAFEKYSDIKVYVYYQQFESNFTVTNKLLKDEKTGFDYFTSYEEAETALNKIETYMIKSDFWAYDYVKATQFMIDTCDDNIIAMYHITADDRVMGSVDSAKKLTQTVQNSKYTTADKKEISRIYVSTLCPNSDKAFDTSSYAYKLAQISGGIAVSNYNAATETEVKDITSETVNVLASKAKSSKTSVSVSTNLIQILGEGNTSKYKVINSAGLNTINLKQKLTKGSAEDYDKDGITDWNEVNTRLIYSILARDSSSNVYSEGTIAPSSLPTFADCRWYYSNSEEPKFYVEQGYEQFVNKNAAMYYNGDKEKVKEKLNKIRILPLISDPTKPDSDGDNENDYQETIKYKTNPLKKNHFSYMNSYLTFNAHNSYDKENKIITTDVQLVYAALADIAYENGLREDYYGNRNLDGYYLVSQPFGESNAIKGKKDGLLGLIDGVNGYPSAEKYVDEWLSAAMKRAGVSASWKKDIDDPYFAMAICVIRMTQIANQSSGKCNKMLWQDTLNRKARNAARWRNCAKQGVISDYDGQYRYYMDAEGTWKSTDGEVHVDNIYLGF